MRLVHVSPNGVQERVGDVVLISDWMPPAGEDLHVGRAAVVNIWPFVSFKICKCKKMYKKHVKDYKFQRRC